MADLYAASGGFGLFQVYAFFVFQCAISNIAFWWNSLGFYIQQPAYQCVFTTEITNPDDVCTAKNICDDDSRIDSWSINWDDPDSLHNWQQKLDLMCRPDWLVGLLGTSFWIGYVSTMLWLPRVADVYGRKKLFAVGLSISLLLYTALILSKNFYLTMVIIFFFGVTNTIRTITGFVYFTEMMPKSKITVATTVLWIIDGCIYLFVVIYFWKISTYTNGLIIIGWCFAFCGALFSWFLPESPVWLLSLNRTEQAIQVMTKIAKINKSEAQLWQAADQARVDMLEQQRTSERSESLEKAKETPPIMFYLRQPKIRLNLGIMMIVWLTSSLDFYLITFLVNTFDQVYLSALASSLADFVAYAASGFLYPILKARVSFISFFGLSLAGGIVILAYGLQHQDSWTFILLILIVKLGISAAINIVYVAHCDIFPPLFAASALGYCNVLARLFTSMSVLMANLDEPSPMWIFTVTAGLACILSFGLKPPKAEVATAAGQIKDLEITEEVDENNNTKSSVFTQ